VCQTNTRKESWVRDWLPDEGLNSRIMIFKHNSAWKEHALGKSLKAHGDDLVRALELRRGSEEV